jgi:hypothetical protein
MMNMRDKRCTARKGGLPDVECRVGKGSGDGDGGVHNEIEECKSRSRSSNPAQQPIYTEHRRNKIEVWCCG